MRDPWFRLEHTNDGDVIGAVAGPTAPSAPNVSPSLAFLNLVLICGKLYGKLRASHTSLYHHVDAQRNSQGPGMSLIPF